MQLVYDEAVRAREFGMLGKWVGHPAQLFAVLLAYEAGIRRGPRGGAEKLEAYHRSVEEGKGATMIGGVMPTGRPTGTPGWCCGMRRRSADSTRRGHSPWGSSSDERDSRREQALRMTSSGRSNAPRAGKGGTSRTSGW